MRWITGTIWRWLRSRKTNAIANPIQRSRLPSSVDWSRFAREQKMIELVRTIRECRTVRTVEQPNMAELRQIEATLTSVSVQLENAIRTAM